MKQYKLVIVENDEDERFFMREEFEAFEAFDVLGEFVNGDTLFEWLAQNPSDLPDIILSDLNMPGKNGYDIISQIKSNPAYTDVKVIITSTSPVISIREKCLSMGASEYLIKPEIFVDYGQYVKELYRKIDS
ncbi:response regulator [Dyadobacter sp. CY323]|uniref:response regulator n=1 Tax=Dyadobacter sp. CY323 TaxID=2907302 RepID=UPI001F305454|nr:response regulator [Dyadobacter sp. CY323]MCE6991062.1 response regulator [Dyadobacter sp. CY323]